MQTRNLLDYNINNIKLKCPKCGSTNVHSVVEKVNHYYDRQETYIRNDMFLCLECMYMDYWNYFDKLLLKD